MMWATGEGQMAPLLSAMMFLAFSLPSVARGALVALVISIKPQFAFVAPLVLWSDRPAFISMMATGAALLAGYVLIFGAETWLAWFEAFARFRDDTRTLGVDPMVTTLAGRAQAYGYPQLPFLALALAISAYLAIRKPIDDLAALTVGCSIFASPYALPYDLVAIAPWAAERLQKDRLDWRVVPNVLLYIHMLFPIAWLLSLVGRNQGALAVPCPTSKASSA
jgi:hypothetical protein